MSHATAIYALASDDEEPRYVGQARAANACVESAMRVRLVGHKSAARCGSPLPVAEWIRSVEFRVYIHLIAIIYGDVPGAGSAEKVERLWIRAIPPDRSVNMVHNTRFRR